MSLTSINKKMDELQAEMDRLREEKSNIVESQDKILADLIHEKMCCRNHTDGCDWYYDRGDWNSWSRREYLEKARNILNSGISLNTAKEVIQQL